MMSLLAGLGACAQGIEDDGDDPDEPPTGTSVYKYKRDIELSEGAPEGYAVHIDFDHAQLVTDAKALATGDDVRVFFKDDLGEAELDRVVDPASGWNKPTTRVWFRTVQAPQGVFVYTFAYGKGSAENPPQNGVNVFDFYDDFEDGTLDPTWTLSAIGGGTFDEAVLDPASPDYIEQEGYARVGGVGADIGDVSDSFVFLQRTMNGDFAVEVEMLDVSGSLGAVAKMGGVMIRQNDTADARYMAATLVNTPRERSSSVRSSDGAVAQATNFPAEDMFPQFLAVQRIGTSVSTRYTENGFTWIPLGNPATIDFGEPVIAGVPFSNASGDDGYAHIGSIRYRRLVNPEPSATLAAEDQ
jgi:hypothetical protein